MRIPHCESLLDPRLSVFMWFLKYLSVSYSDTVLLPEDVMTPESVQVRIQIVFLSDIAFLN